MWLQEKDHASHDMMLLHFRCKLC